MILTTAPYATTAYATTPYPTTPYPTTPHPIPTDPTAPPYATTTPEPEHCMRTWGCICKEGYVWTEVRNPVTHAYDFVCVPDDRCLDDKVCRSDEYFVPRKGYIFSIYSQMHGCIISNLEYYTVYNPEKVNIVTKHDALMVPSNQLKVGMKLIQWQMRLPVDRQHVSALET